jgi:hypothetical protein
VTGIEKCILCGLDCPSEVDREALKGRSLISCPRCGDYWLYDLARHPSQEIQERIHLLSGLCREQKENDGSPPTVTSPMVSNPEVFDREVASRAPSNIRGKAFSILKYIASKSTFPGHELWINPINDYPVGYCKAAEEFEFYLQHLEELGWLNIDNRRRSLGSHAVPVYITAKGWDIISGGQTGHNSDQCFVAMWFSDTVGDVFQNGIKPLEALTGLRMLRIDAKQFNGKICDQIISEINRSRFMIADVTGHRLAVYFEAGYAMGRGLPVIWSCRADDIVNSPNFDTRQYNHILWDTPEELCERLAARISATVLSEKGNNGYMIDKS